MFGGKDGLGPRFGILSVEESVGCWASTVAFESSATFYSFSLLNCLL